MAKNKNKKASGAQGSKDPRAHGVMVSMVSGWLDENYSEKKIFEEMERLNLTNAAQQKALLKEAAQFNKTQKNKKRMDEENSSIRGSVSEQKETNVDTLVEDGKKPGFVARLFGFVRNIAKRIFGFFVGKSSDGQGPNLADRFVAAFSAESHEEKVTGYKDAILEAVDKSVEKLESEYKDLSAIVEEAKHQVAAVSEAIDEVKGALNASHEKLDEADITLSEKEQYGEEEGYESEDSDDDNVIAHDDVDIDMGDDRMELPPESPRPGSPRPFSPPPRSPHPRLSSSESEAPVTAVSHIPAPPSPPVSKTVVSPSAVNPLLDSIRRGKELKPTQKNVSRPSENSDSSKALFENNELLRRASSQSRETDNNDSDDNSEWSVEDVRPGTQRPTSTSSAEVPRSAEMKPISGAPKAPAALIPTPPPAPNKTFIGPPPPPPMPKPINLNVGGEVTPVARTALLDSIKKGKELKAANRGAQSPRPESPKRELSQSEIIANALKARRASSQYGNDSDSESDTDSGYSSSHSNSRNVKRGQTPNDKR